MATAPPANRLGPDPEPLGVRYQAIMERLERAPGPPPARPSPAPRRKGCARLPRSRRRVPVA